MTHRVIPSFSSEATLYARQVLSLALKEHGSFVPVSQIAAGTVRDRDGLHLQVQWLGKGNLIQAEGRFYPDGESGGRLNLYRLCAPGRDNVPLDPKRFDVFNGMDEHGLPRFISSTPWRRPCGIP